MFIAWCFCIIRPQRAAGNAGTVPNGSNRNGVQNQAVEMNPLAGSTADVLGYTQVRQAYVSPRSYGNGISNQFENTPMVETMSPPPYAPYCQPHPDVKD